jgi:hypothetical protein
MLSSLQETDRLIEREWREYPPLPSLSERILAIDKIMAELPPAAEAPQEFASKRVHARLRWMRFSTGFMGLIALFSLLWTSYKLGFAQGMQKNSYKIRSASSIPRTSSYTSSAVINRMHL